MTTKTAPATTAKCADCGRKLTAAASVTRKRGPVCQARYEQRVAAIAAAEQPARLAKAVELIQDGGIVQVAGSLYLAVSSDGATRYEVDAVTRTCTCKAGQYGRACYHATSAALLAA